MGYSQRHLLSVLEFLHNIRNNEYAQAGRAVFFSALNGLRHLLRLSGLVRELLVNWRVWFRCTTSPGVFVILKILRYQYCIYHSNIYYGWFPCPFYIFGKYRYERSEIRWGQGITCRCLMPNHTDSQSPLVDVFQSRSLRSRYR